MIKKKCNATCCVGKFELKLFFEPFDVTENILISAM